MIAGNGIDHTDVAALLTDLTDRCLVTLDTRHGSPRFGLLETIRDYAVDQLRTPVG